MTFNHTFRGKFEGLLRRFKFEKNPRKKRRQEYSRLNGHHDLNQEEDDEEYEVDQQISQELEERNYESYENVHNIEKNYYYEN